MKLYDLTISVLWTMPDDDERAVAEVERIKAHLAKLEGLGNLDVAPCTMSKHTPDDCSDTTHVADW